MLDRRMLIIQNALHDFNERGYVGTSINDIAHKSGISKATFFHYFKNKEELVNEVFLYCKKVYLTIPGCLTLIYNCTQEEIIEIFKFNYEHQEELRFINSMEYSPFVSEEVKKQGASMHFESRQIIAKAQENKEIIDLDPTYIYMFITNSTLNCLNDVFKDGCMDVDYMMKIVKFIQKAITL